MKEPYFEAQANYIKVYPKLDKIYIGRNDTHTYFTSDGYTLHIIPNEYCLLDIERILGDRKLMSNLLIENFEKESYEPAVITGYIPNPKYKEVAIIENKNMSVWVNKAYLKDFPNDVTFHIAGEKKAVQVRFNGDVCGYIMPINKNKG